MLVERKYIMTELERAAKRIAELEQAINGLEKIIERATLNEDMLMEVILTLRPELREELKKN